MPITRLASSSRPSATILSVRLSIRAKVWHGQGKDSISICEKGARPVCRKSARNMARPAAREKFDSMDHALHVEKIDFRIPFRIETESRILMAASP